MEIWKSTLHMIMRKSPCSLSSQHSVRPRPNHQTLLVKHGKCAVQPMFDRLATCKNIPWQAKVTKFAVWCFWKSSKSYFALMQTKHFGQTMSLDVAKRFVWQAYLKCWTNNVWSFGQGLKDYSFVVKDFGSALKARFLDFWKQTKILFKEQLNLKMEKFVE